MADQGLGRTGMFTFSATDNNTITPRTEVAFGATTPISTTGGDSTATTMAEYWDPNTSTWVQFPLTVEVTQSA